MISYTRTQILFWMVTLFLVVSPFFVLMLAPVHAADFGLSEAARESGFTEITGEIGEGQAKARVQSAIGKIIGSVLAFVGVIFLLLIIYGGILFMTAKGNEESMTKAKKILGGAVLGLVIIFAAYALTAFILQAIQGAVAT